MKYIIALSANDDYFYRTYLPDMNFVSVPFAEFTVTFSSALFGGKGGKLLYVMAPTPVPSQARVYIFVLVVNKLLF